MRTDRHCPTEQQPQVEETEFARKESTATIKFFQKYRNHNIMHSSPRPLPLHLVWMISCKWNPQLFFLSRKRRTTVPSFCCHERQVFDEHKVLSSLNCSEQRMSYCIFACITCTRYTENSKLKSGCANFGVQRGFMALLFGMAGKVALRQHAGMFFFFFSFFCGLVFGMWVICRGGLYARKYWSALDST